MLMGASGAGKSTLLDILTNRKTVGTIEGHVLFNRTQRTPCITKNTAYVMQDNVHIGVLTVGETLMFAAQLRLDEGLSREEKQERIDGIVSILGLQHVVDSTVGDENTRGISGGQLKRFFFSFACVLKYLFYY